MASFGERLRHEREMRGVSLREIADATKISVRFLRALEEDRLDLLPGGLFPKAFVRQYASFLGLEVEKLAAEFVAAHGDAVPERRSTPPLEPGRRIAPGHMILAGIGLLLVALSFLRPASERRARVSATPTPAAVASAVLPTDRVLPAATSARAGAPSDNLVLSMTARQECWVKVRADGRTVLDRVLSEGESETLEARGELVLSVGNAGGLSIRVNDSPTRRPLGKSGEVLKDIVITHQNLPKLVDDGRSS